MKTLTKLKLIELLRTKETVAFLRDGEYMDISKDQALESFDSKQGGPSEGYVLETENHVWIAADTDWKEEKLWRVGGVQ